MYLASVILLLAVYPLALIAIEWLTNGHSAGLMPLVGKWFVFGFGNLSMGPLGPQRSSWARGYCRHP